MTIHCSQCFYFPGHMTMSERSIVVEGEIRGNEYDRIQFDEKVNINHRIPRDAKAVVTCDSGHQWYLDPFFCVTRRKKEKKLFPLFDKKKESANTTKTYAKAQGIRSGYRIPVSRDYNKKLSVPMNLWEGFVYWWEQDHDEKKRGKRINEYEDHWSKR